MSPTPLLDVSESILVASSFSTCEISKNPGIYIFNPDKSQIIKKDDIDCSFYTNYRIDYRKGKNQTSFYNLQKTIMEDQKI